mmetsp:Transcript_10809/g.31466  ORF Transcript_10809/g.31466 Transcript_10809/m.31466 type:complete len:402 (+) Transcript_10809:453-1658(+)
MISSSLPHRPISSRRLDRCVLLVLFVLLVSDVLSGLLPASFTSTTSRTGRPLGLVPVASAWEWTDYVVGGKGSDDDEADQRKTLTHAEISGLRVRDIKRRLARSHGYGADELARMLDKKDLIAALSKEESKVKKKYQNKKRRKLLWKGLFVALMCVVTIVGWPLWVQATEVMAVNWQVYYDRKKHEISQCIEFHSFKGAIGVLLLSVLDGFRFWLSATVLLSWVLSSDSYYRRYMFPIPSLSIRPGQFMGEKVANGPLGRYGMNIAPMAITWSMGFVRGKIEYWTGKALSKAAKRRRKQARSGETEEEKKARKAARKAAKRAAAEEKEKKQQEIWQKEMERRKEMAQKASEQLYGGVNSNRNAGQHHEESEEQNESRIPDNDYDDAKREFEADMEDINDLD